MAALHNLNTLFILLLILCLLAVVLFLYVRRINARLNQSIKLINELYQLNQSQALTLSELTREVQSNSHEQFKTSSEKSLFNLHAQTEELSKRVLTLENETQKLQQEDPELKMYSRAHQLVKEGLSIEDVMEASQLPRAEVEVLIGLQRHQKSLKL